MMTGLFRDRDSAVRAYESLKARGYSYDDVNIVMSDDTRRKHFAAATSSQTETETGNKAAKGAGSAKPRSTDDAEYLRRTWTDSRASTSTRACRARRRTTADPRLASGDQKRKSPKTGLFRNRPA
jgi:hypothetical protein